MIFDPQIYGAPVAAILDLDGAGQRLMPLTQAAGSDQARAAIREAGARQLFPQARAPEAAFAGLYFYFDCWKDAHEAADIPGPEGAYWHAIVHRQEPDGSNSGYWFRQVGTHAIFPALRDAAAAIGIATGPRWKPEAFIELCEKARQSPGSAIERQAMEVQRAEWQLLFEYCARP
jgi:hypothetical protein